MVTKPQYVR